MFLLFFVCILKCFNHGILLLCRNSINQIPKIMSEKKTISSSEKLFKQFSRPLYRRNNWSKKTFKPITFNWILCSLCVRLCIVQHCKMKLANGIFFFKMAIFSHKNATNNSFYHVCANWECEYIYVHPCMENKCTWCTQDVSNMLASSVWAYFFPPLSRSLSRWPFSPHCEYFQSKEQFSCWT